ncbi:Rieske (2Fe-2S) protein [Pseudomonas coleopterorum]|uniref:Rieske (2Fe-2S) protein n=1 Tax=Pseudomonas coleopterorum TaxID=1605838 RepID=UPI001FCE7609|nr:Rieske (2Fe-2S) protein [Pseudomonas coleopterorum]
MKPIYLCAQASLAEGCARGFDPLGRGHDTLMVLRWQGELKAWLNRCPHLEVPMHYRKDRFMSADRRLCVLGPCLGQSLRPQPLYVDEQGGVWLSAGELACDDRSIRP